ncbi:MAG: HAD family hydrolase [Acidobacteria bacterium]|nr:HAD family hydrolase [Acidobacteriota bacterium]
MIAIDIPGLGPLRLRHLVLDVNGTLALDGGLIGGVGERLRRLADELEIHLVTADTFGTTDSIARSLGLRSTLIPPGGQAEAKLAYVERLGADAVAAIGNGANDARMLERAALGIAVLGPEGAATAALLAAPVAVGGIHCGLDLLLHPRRLAATLRR